MLKIDTPKALEPFNLSMQHAIVPTWPIFPLAMTSAVTSLNDYHSFSLTPVISCFKKIVLSFIKNLIPAELGGYHAQSMRGCNHHWTLFSPFPPGAASHKQYVRMLFVDFSYGIDLNIEHRRAPQTIKFVDDTTVVGPISDKGESFYKQEKKSN